MARPDKVTRTLKETRITALVVNIQNGETTDYTALFPKPFKNDEKALKAVNAIIDSGLKAVAIRKTETVETLYEMSLETFMLNAKKVEKR